MPTRLCLSSARGKIALKIVKRRFVAAFDLAHTPRALLLVFGSEKLFARDQLIGDLGKLHDQVHHVFLVDWRAEHRERLQFLR